MKKLSLSIILAALCLSLCSCMVATTDESELASKGVFRCFSPFSASQY